MAAGNAKLLAEEIFLDPELLFGPFDTFPDFQNLFPKSYRNHGDVRLLYKSFQKQRKLLQQQVKRKIQQKCEEAPKDMVDQEGLTLQERPLTLSDAVQLLEILAQNLEKESQIIKENMMKSEKEIERVCKGVNDGLLQQFPGPVDDKYYTTLEGATKLLK